MINPKLLKKLKNQDMQLPEAIAPRKPQDTATTELAKLEVS